MTSLRLIAIAAFAVAGCASVEAKSHVPLAYPASPAMHARAERGAARLGCRASTAHDGRVTTVTCGDEAVVLYDDLRNDGRWYTAATCDKTQQECRDFARLILDAGTESAPRSAAPSGTGGGPR